MSFKGAFYCGSIVLLLTSSVEACISLPKNFQLSGATFNDVMNFNTLNIAAGNRITLTPTNGARLRDDGTNTITVYRDPTTNKICFNIGAAAAQCAATITGDDAILDRNGVKKGIIQYQNNNFYVFSVDGSGNKDLSRPYIKVEFTDNDNMHIDSYDRSGAVGTFNVVRQTQTFRSLSRQSQVEGSVDLRGSALSLTPSGCQGSLDQSSFTPGSTAVGPAGQGRR